MKAAPFDYCRAENIDQACALLAADDGARVIAGGQTLVPLMAMTLDAVLIARAGGENAEIPAADFFIGPMITAMPIGGVLTAVRFPVWKGKVGGGAGRT